VLLAGNVGTNPLLVSARQILPMKRGLADENTEAYLGKLLFTSTLL
jgi:hypothetical protein